MYLGDYLHSMYVDKCAQHPQKETLEKETLEKDEKKKKEVKQMDLEYYLFKKKIGRIKFASMLGISREKLYAIFLGSDMKLTLAKKIESITNGEITVDDLYKYILSKQKPLPSNVD